MQTKLCVSPDFPEKPWFRGTNTLLGFFLISNRKHVRSPPSCLLPFHVQNCQSSSAESADHSGSACVWCPEGKRTYQWRWRRIICLPVMEHDIAVKIAIFPVFGWKFPGKQDTAETHPGRGYVSTRSQISLISFFFSHISFPSHKASRATSSMILWLVHADAERRLGSWWISVQRLRWWTFVKLRFVRN